MAIPEPNWPLSPDPERGDPFTPPRPLALAVRDSWRIRLLLGLALGCLGGLLHAALIRASLPALSLAAVYPCLASAALLGGPIAACAALAVATAALFMLAPPGLASGEIDIVLFVLGGAFVAAISGLARATRRRMTADAVRRNQERLRLAVEAGAIGLFEADFVAQTATLTAKEREILGLPLDAPLAPGAVDALVLEEDRDARARALAAAMDPGGDGVYRTHYRIRRANDGAIRWVSARGQAYFDNGKVARVVGVNRDITEEMNAEATLREKARLAERLSGLAEALPGAVYSYELGEDGQAFLSYASAQIEDVLGFGPTAFANDVLAITDRIHAEDIASVFEAVAESRRDMTPWRSTFRFQHPCKGLVWIEGFSTPVRATGETDRVVWHGYMLDVTDHMRAAAALAASEARARAVIEGAAEAIFTFGADGRIRTANAACTRIFGHPVEEMIGMAVRRLAPDAENLAPQGSAAEANGADREVKGLRANGETFPLSLSVSQADLEGARLYFGFARDLTERRRIEARMRQLNDERLASLESVAASLAHEVNQPLAAGATFLTVARRMLAAPDGRGTTKIEQALEKASDQMVRAGKIITRARQFSRRGEPDKTFQSLRDLVREVVRTLGEDRELADFRLIEKLDGGEDRVLVDRVQIAQVLVNLIRNAAQANGAAGPRGAEASAPDPSDIVVATARDGDEIRVSVIDSGGGLSVEATESLFEPFFTTRPEGMGIGLSLSRAIVEAHFGRIWAEANPRGGAIFCFTLPLAEMEEP